MCEMPLGALRKGARLLIVNQSETYLDERADVVLHEDVAEALPAIVLPSPPVGEDQHAPTAAAPAPPVDDAPSPDAAAAPAAPSP